jgi:hypothetical protein
MTAGTNRLSNILIVGADTAAATLTSIAAICAVKTIAIDATSHQKEYRG